jgi:hypothetical protein
VIQCRFFVTERDARRSAKPPFRHRVLAAATESSPIVKFRFLFPILAASAALAGCLGNSGDSLPPPNGIQPVIGDGIVGVTWTSLADVSYLVFGSTNPNLTTLNWLDAGIAGFAVNNQGTKAQPPAFLCGATNGIDFYFTIDAHSGTAPGGPGSPVVKATGRSAGSAGLWTLGMPIGANVNGVGYAAITGCVSTGAPTMPSGLYVAVGPAGAIFTAPNGRSSWTSRSPAGYTTDLYAVASYTSPISTAAAPVFLIVAVGAGGAVITSADGVTWTSRVAASGSAPILRSVSLANGVFVAVGDGGHIQTSVDGVTWTTQTSGTTVNLHAVACVVSTCYAVGDAGVIALSVNGGGIWTAQTVGGGASALRAVTYGNFDNNLTAPGVVGIGGSAPTSINTWVVVGDAGAAFVNANGAGTWTSVPFASAPNLALVSYTSQFVAIDAAGNVYTSRIGSSGTWSAPAATGLASAAGIISNGYGYAAVGQAGDNAFSF